MVEQHLNPSDHESKAKSHTHITHQTYRLSFLAFQMVSSSLGTTMRKCGLNFFRSDLKLRTFE